jgi:BCCT family betaine/carnitine transporter
LSDTGIPDPEGPTNVIDTDYTVGQDNIRDRIGPLVFDIHNPVFLISGLVIVAFVIVTLALQNEADAFFTAVRDWLTANLDWFFLIAGNVFVLVCLAVIVLPWGSIRIGGRDATPDFSYTAWFSMLFAAGMGIGLMFYGVAEPIGHFDAAFGGTAGEGGARTDWAPLGGAAGDAEAARRLAMAATIFHWGLCR